MLVYSIKNYKLGYFNTPFYAENDSQALNYVQNVLMHDTAGIMIGLKGDLELYCLGTFDCAEGILYPELTYVNDDVGTYTNRYVSNLEDIFDTIPKEKLKPELTKEDLNRAYEKIKALEARVEDYELKFANHKHYRKEILK